MTRDDIIRMAREAHLDVYGLGKSYEAFANALERFANIVAAVEREACAKVCEALGRGHGVAFAEYDCAAAIRARGEK